MNEPAFAICSPADDHFRFVGRLGTERRIRLLPFPPAPSTGIAAPTLAESKLTPFPAQTHLPKGAPNILIMILLDDIGFGVSDTFGGPVHTPTLSRLAKEGISYNESP